MQEAQLIHDIGYSVIGASIFGFIAHFFRIPLLLAYLTAGVFLGSNLGFGFIRSSESISVLSRIGLILLMFILGLEIDVKKILYAGRAVLVNGLFQFVGSAGLAYLIFRALNIGGTGSDYSLIYIAIACSLSSTLIVVKILSDRLQLNNLASRITIGILVIQDIWAILFLAVQPNLGHLAPATLAVSLGKVGLLILVSVFWTRYILPLILLKVARVPELLLVVAMGWCFAMCGVGEELGLSAEMGALMAGVGIASFPYHTEISARIMSVRDFFLMLFFVALGLQIPQPNTIVIELTVAMIAFILVSRFLTVFPILYYLGFGNRISLFPALNLSQLSEFSLVMAALGLSYGHIRSEILSAFILTMAITSLISSALIPRGHDVYRILNPLLELLGFKDRITAVDSKDPEVQDQKSELPSIVILGFFREASSLLYEIVRRHSEPVLKRIMVVDLNPEAHRELLNKGITCRYGDIGHTDTLRKLELEKAQILICTIPDSSLKGTTNLKLLRFLKSLAPEARIIVTAERLDLAREMYREGAAYVYIPRVISAHYMAEVLDRIQSSEFANLRESAMKYISQRHEILP